MSDASVQAPSADNGMAPLARERVPLASASAAARAPWYSRPVQLIVVSGLILVAVVIAVTWSLLTNLRDRDLADKERTLESLATMLAEQLDRSFQSIERIQTVVIEQMQSTGVSSPEDFKQRLSGYDTHQRFTDLISGLPHIDAIILTDAKGDQLLARLADPRPRQYGAGLFRDVSGRTLSTVVCRETPAQPGDRTMGAADPA